MKQPLSDNSPGLSQQQLYSILDHSYDEIYVFDGNGVILYANEACERNYNLKVADIIGKTVYECYQKYQYHPFLSPIVLHERKRITMEHMSNTGKKLVITATPVLNNLGEVEMVVMNTRDLDHLAHIKHDIDECQSLSDLYHLDSGISQEESLCLEAKISQDPAFLKCIEVAGLIAPTDANVLLLGETGTGKTLMAKYIHQKSLHHNGPFFTVNCAAIPEYLLESELFGHKKGAFTGAVADKVGIFELVKNGTLLLDEISEIPLHIQAKLLHVIQERTFLPVGHTTQHKLEARIVSASNKDLQQEVKAGRFRDDLYYRLNVIEIYLPPLRQRHGDIANLSRSFLERFNTQYKTYHQLTPACLEILDQYSWPGNIRQLQNCLERLVLMCPEEQIQPKHLPQSLLKGIAQEKESHESNDCSMSEDIRLAGMLEAVERESIVAAYQQHGSSRKVAQALGISQSKANRLIQKYVRNA